MKRITWIDRRKSELYKSTKSEGLIICTGYTSANGAIYALDVNKIDKPMIGNKELLDIR